ncbi:hypothetical protein FOE78_01585 [Microlunatus elymi]|uniref:Uncharacterized protein n=1 Tax=Microlunatus elymi TaxID=2596828 RepID=A0A516PUE8_9ACTN|nr:hypothetical protein [Microlunatus elymi]QDP94779.1 hypothetical protein FOE78_01585 [Microlunatus elymi]
MSVRRRPTSRTTLMVRAVLSIVVLGCCLLGGCHGSEQTGAAGADQRSTPAASAPHDPNAPAPVGFTAPPADQIDVPVGDQVDQGLSDVAATSSTIVAVGGEESANLRRPLFITSTDGGKHFRRGVVRADTLGRLGNDEYAYHVAADGNAGFLALGRDSAGRHLSWTSADGVTWRRSADVGRAFEEDENVAGLARGGGHWVAAGTAQDPDSDRVRVLTWISKDGKKWTRREVPVSFADLPGTLSADRFAVHGKDLIITGDLKDNSNPEQPNRIVVLRSADAGHSWYVVDTPADLGGGYRAYLNHLVFADGRFIAAAIGDGADRDDDSSWDGVLLSGGVHGDSWRTVAKPTTFGTDADDYADVLVHTSAGWVLGGSVGKSPSDARLAVGRSVDQLRRVDADAFVGAASQSLYDGVALGDTAFLLGTDERTGSSDPMMIRVRNGRAARIELPIAGATPSAEVASMINTPAGYRAVGSVNGTPLAWTSADGKGWAPLVLPARGRDGVTTAGAYDLADDGDGTTIAVGTLNRTRGSRIGAWRITGDRRVEQLDDADFVSRVADDYGYLDADAVTHSDRGWLIVGTEYADRRTDAVFLHSDDGRTWERGVGTTKIKLSTTERSDGRTPWTTFRDPGGGLSISDAISTDHGFWVFGSRSQSARGGERHDVPVVWSSKDGKTWGASQRLPLPAGVRDVDVSTVGADRTGRLVVAGGSSTAVPESARRTLTWTLAPNAKTWRLAAAMPGQARLSGIVKIPGGWLAVGSDWSGADQNAILWTSRDAKNWTAVPGVIRSSGPGRQSLEQAIADGARIRLLGRDVPPTGGGYFTAAIDTPKP